MISLAESHEIEVDAEIIFSIGGTFAHKLFQFVEGCDIVQIGRYQLLNGVARIGRHFEIMEMEMRMEMKLKFAISTNDFVHANDGEMEMEMAVDAH